MNPIDTHSSTKTESQNPFFHVSDALRAVRKRVLTAKGIRELLKIFAERISLEDGENLTVLHKDYGGGTVFIPQPLACIDINNPLIQALLNDKPLSDLPEISIEIQQSQLDKCTLYLNHAPHCKLAGFTDYQTVLIIPLHLSDEKNAGLLIFTSQQGGAFRNNLKSYEYSADPLSYYLHHNVRMRRNQHLLNFIKTTSEAEMGESELFLLIGQYLNRWYQHDDVYLLIKHPLDDQRLLLAYKTDQNEPQNYRDHELSDEHLGSIIGNQVVLKQLEQGPVSLHSHKTMQELGLANSIQSFLGAPMRRVGGNVYGYFIIHNTKETHAFEDGEEYMLDAITDYAAQRLGVLREKSKNNELDKISQLTLSKRHISEKQLYQTVQKSLQALYGKHVTLAVARYDEDSERFSTAFDPQNLILTGSQEKSFKGKTFAPAKACLNENKTTIVKHAGKNYFLAPMRVREKSIGCFLLPANHIDPYASQFIDKMSDQVAIALDAQERDKKRQGVLLDFIKEVDDIPIDATLDEKQLLSLVKKHTKRVMDTSNLFIARYDKESEMISFPLMLDGGEPYKKSDGSEMPPRKLDRNSQGKTESIILERKPILHYTKADADAFYDAPGRSEFAGNRFAAWLGVPVILSGDVIAVIAVYHKTDDDVYSEHDQFFLTMVADKISNLYQIVEIQEANRKLEEANRKLEEALADNTELEEANRKLEEANRKLEEANRKLEEANRKLEEALADNTELEEANRKLEDRINRKISHRKISSVLNYGLENIDLLLKSSYQDIKDISRTTTGLDFTRKMLKQATEYLDELKIKIKEFNHYSNKKMQTTDLYELFQEARSEASQSEKNLPLPKEDITEKDQLSKASAYIDEELIYTIFYLTLEEIYLVYKTNQLIEDRTYSSYGFKATDTEITLKIKISSTTTLKPIPQGSARFQKLEKLINDANGEIKININIEEKILKIDILFRKKYSNIIYYLFIKNIVIMRKIKTELVNNGYQVSVIENKENLENKKNHYNLIIDTEKANEIDNYSDLTNINKIFLIYSKPSDKVSLLAEKTNFLDFNKLKEDSSNYIINKLCR